eukprot:g1238.t1
MLHDCEGEISNFRRNLSTQTFDTFQFLNPIDAKHTIESAVARAFPLSSMQKAGSLLSKTLRSKDDGKGGHLKTVDFKERTTSSVVSPPDFSSPLLQSYNPLNVKEGQVEELFEKICTKLDEGNEVRDNIDEISQTIEQMPHTLEEVDEWDFRRGIIAQRQPFIRQEEMVYQNQPNIPQIINTSLPCGRFGGTLWGLQTGVRICLYPFNYDKQVSDSIFLHGMWDSDLMSFAMRWLQLLKSSSGPFGSGVVIDAGANVGTLSLLSAQLGYRVLAFEANANTASLLARSVIINRYEYLITIFRNALGEKAETGSIYVPTENLGGSKVVTSFNGEVTNKIYHKEPGNVQIIPLDAAIPTIQSILIDVAKAMDGGAVTGAGLGGLGASSRPRREISLLKLDVETMEPRVIRGARHLFEKFSIPLIILEVSSLGWEKQGCKMEMVFRCFLEMGYALVFFKEKKHAPITTILQLEKWLHNEPDVAKGALTDVAFVLNEYLTWIIE